jgi:hypothetical protein
MGIIKGLNFRTMLVYVIYFVIIVFIVMIAFVITSRCNNDNKKEGMTLKTDCDVRYRSCLIACTTREGIFNKKCFRECQRNSPVC